MALDLTTSNCTVFIFSPIQFIERLKVSFMEASRKYAEANRNTEIDVKFASTVEELVQSGCSKAQADYIAIFVDTKNGNNCLRCEQYLRTISAKFVMTRLCIVNGTCQSGLLSATKELLRIGDRFRIPVINAEVADDQGCRLVGEKIIKLGATVSGITHGVPIIIPTPRDINPNSFAGPRPQSSPSPSPQI